MHVYNEYSYPKNKIFFCSLNYLNRSLQEIYKIPKPNPKYSNTQKIENLNLRIFSLFLNQSYI